MQGGVLNIYIYILERNGMCKVRMGVNMYWVLYGRINEYCKERVIHSCKVCLSGTHNINKYRLYKQIYYIK